jgi:hypothetical protein
MVPAPASRLCAPLAALPTRGDLDETDSHLGRLGTARRTPRGCGMNEPNNDIRRHACGFGLLLKFFEQSAVSPPAPTKASPGGRPR